MRPVIGGRGGGEVGGGEGVGGVGLALVIVESAAVLALDGPGVGGDGALVVGDEIGDHRASALLRRELWVLRSQSDTSHFYYFSFFNTKKERDWEMKLQ